MHLVTQSYSASAVLCFLTKCIDRVAMTSGNCCRLSHQIENCRLYAGRKGVIILKVAIGRHSSMRVMCAACQPVATAHAQQSSRQCIRYASCQMLPHMTICIAGACQRLNESSGLTDDGLQEQQLWQRIWVQQYLAADETFSGL